MFSLQQFFGKADKFYVLLEEAAVQADTSVQLVIQMIKTPREARKLDDLVLARRKEKKIAETISEELVNTFVTGLEREDIEALALALRKIPKTVGKFAERLVLADPIVDGSQFLPQAEMMERCTAVILAMIRQLHVAQHLDKLKEMNDKLQYIEGEADRLMLDLLKDLYSGKYQAIEAIIIRDLYELMEKVIDRCRDAGNVVMHIVLKNS